MLGGNFRSNPPKENSAFRVNLLEVLDASEDLSDEELRLELSKMLEASYEKYVPRKADIVLKRIH